MLTVFYFGSSSGMVYNVHYCLDQIFLSANTKSNTCDLCGTDKKKDCCNDEVKVLKTDVAQKADISTIDHSSFAAVLTPVYYAKFLMLVLQRNQFAVQVNAPPDQSELPLFISYCNFRI